jgi:FkbM family methyltransferase
MQQSTDVSLVEIAGLYLFYFRRDHAFTYILQDPRARVISLEDVRIEWRQGDIDWKVAWDVKGLGPFALASIHYWRQDIDFDYIDVGANGGLTTIAQAVFYKRCNRSNKIYAFEPGDVFPLLNEAVRVNRVDDMTTCVRAALTDRAGKVEFFVTPAQSPASSLLKAATSRPGIVESNSIFVDAITFDDFSHTLRPAAGLLVKIDAEGVDFKVINGMQRTLADRFCTLQIELYPALVDTYVEPISALTRLASDFELIDLGTSPPQRIDPAPTTIAAFVEKVRGLQMPTTDVFLVPKRLPSAGELVERILAG